MGLGLGFGFGLGRRCGLERSMLPMSFLILSVGGMAAVVRAPVTDAPSWLGATFSPSVPSRCCADGQPTEPLVTAETRLAFARSAGPRAMATDDSLPSSTPSPVDSPGRAASGEACGKCGKCGKLCGKLGSSYST